MTRTINPNLVTLCEILNDLSYHDGTSLGTQLGMTRTAVWKLIKKLQLHGIVIKVDKAKGYAFTTPLKLFNKQAIIADLVAPEWGLHIFESIPSTNNFLNHACKEDKQICLTEYQTAGRGRLVRSWHSPFAQNICLSVSYLFTKDISDLGGLSLAVALWVCRAIESIYALPVPIKLKWPNDLYYEGQKLGGILVDLQAETHGHCRVVIGIGLNVNVAHIDKAELPTPWTSLCQITGALSDRNKLASALINQLSQGLIQYQQQGFGAVIEAWEARDHLQGHPVKLRWANEVVEGIAAGINIQGHLGLRFADGSIKYFSSGEASLHR